LLEVILSDEMTLCIETRKFHRNVSGKSFMELHKLFEGQYNELEEKVDAVAEHIGKLGGKNLGTMKKFFELARLKE
jgi:starvation-inducible DNA-binding protein